MINELKVGIFLAVLSLMAVVGVNSASATSVVFDADTIVSIDGHDYIIRSGSAATTVVVNPTTLVLTIPNASTFTLASNAGYTLTNADDLAASTTATCSTGVSTVAYTASGARTLTFTPTTVQICGNSGGGGGGGGGSSRSSSSVATVTPAATPAVVCAPGELFSPATGARCNVTSSVSTPVNSEVMTKKVYNFGTTTLKNGSRGEAAKELQRFLNAKLSLGLVVDGIIGPKTIAVIKTWQKANNLVADGLIGPKTKAKMNASVQ